METNQAAKATSLEANLAFNNAGQNLQLSYD
jgi:hypothetical protein